MDEKLSVPARVALSFGWGKFPLWCRALDDSGDVDHATLSHLSNLSERLSTWNALADATLTAYDFQ